ncbi:hypothetical protein ACE7GA_20330 [Roseomonas sp. CCTCC AB2023176]|uniref:hypothetical protein n=1 Tax=Roseomonas sp. CCTCC AB2023176 TaxID=3342640 RepID=UPI0035DB0BFA
MSESLDDRRRALEEAFFAAQDRALIERLRQDDATKDPRSALRQASGISDEALLDRVAGLGLDAASFAAISLVPLVAVAWADGTLDERERQAVLSAASEAGIAAGSPAQGLLSSWLGSAPPASLIETWEATTRATVAGMDHHARRTLHDTVVGRARRIAEAAGGFLGLTSKVSDAEAAMLRRLDAAFTS